MAEDKGKPRAHEDGWFVSIFKAVVEWLTSWF